MKQLSYDISLLSKDKLQKIEDKLNKSKYFNKYRINYFSGTTELTIQSLESKLFNYIKQIIK